MPKGVAREMTDASEVAGLMAPLIEERLAVDVELVILADIRRIVGETVAKMIDTGFKFAQPFAPFVVDSVALQVGKRLMGMAVNGMQDAVSYAALAVNLGVSQGLSFAILPADGVGVVEAKPFSVDLSVADAIDALLIDIFVAKKPVEDIGTLGFLIAKSVEKGNVEAEIFLLEQLVAKLAGGRGVITRLRRLVELTMERDKQRAIGYLHQIKAIYSERLAKNAAKNIKGVDAEIAALEGRSKRALEVELVVSGVEVVEIGRAVGVTGANLGFVDESGDEETVPGDVFVAEPATPEAVEPVEVEAAVEPEKATDSLDEKHCPEIAAALRNLESMGSDAVIGMVRMAIRENDNDALSAFRLRLLRSANSKSAFDLLRANVAVADVLVEFGLYAEAIEHQKRALELRRNFRRDLDDRVEEGPLGDKLAEFMRLAEQSATRVVSVPVQDVGEHGNGDESGGRRRGRGRSRDRREGEGRGCEARPGISGVENNFLRFVNLIREAFKAKNTRAVLSYAQQLLEPAFEMRTSKDLRAANIGAANFFEDVGEYAMSVRHWQKVLDLQEAHPLADEPASQYYIGRTRRNLERVRARCPQVF